MKFAVVDIAESHFSDIYPDLTTVVKLLGMHPILLPAIILLAAVCSAPSSLFAQGGLTPPGAPTPTMKSLDQIEPRTPISSLPYTISTSGSYYLTKNLAANGSTAGIIVSADNVTIDLCGFAITGGGSGTVAGINVPNAQKNLCVRNGTVSGWSYSGIEAVSASNSLFEDLRLSANADGLDAGDGTTVKFCTATGNIIGISLVSTSTALNCTCNGNQIGIDALDGCRIVDCTAAGNSSYNIFTGTNCTVARCTVYSGGFGIYTSSNCLVDNCTAAFCANGISCPSSTVRGCEVSNCSQSGIQVTSNCVVVRNSLVGNNSSGTGNLGGLVATASGNRIEGNSFVGNGNAGLYISGGAGPHVTGNLIVGNSFSGTLYIVDAGNTIGPLVNMASGGGVITSTNPWANIAY